MKLWTTNLIGDATLTETSQNAEFPAENVQSQQISKVWKTLGLVATETLVMDFGTAVNVGAFMVAGHNFDGTETNVKIQGNASDSWGSPTVDEAMTVLVGKPFKAEFTPDSHRYWRLTFDKANAADIRDIGRLFIGLTIDTGAAGDPDYTGVTITTVDPSNVVKSVGGQSYYEQKTPFDQITLQTTFLDETERAIYGVAYDLVGKHTPWFLQITEQSPLDEIYYLRFTSDFGRKVGSFDSQFHWDLQIDLEEQI